MTEIIAAGGLVTNEKDELLMMFRRGKWDLPKGKLDEGETIPECALREVGEETGVQNLTLGHFIGKTHHQYFDTYLGYEVQKTTHWYAMSVKGVQNLVPQTEEDITELAWVDDKMLEKYLINTYPTIVEIISVYKKSIRA